MIIQSDRTAPADPAFDELVKRTIADIEMGNNGYASFARDEKLAAAVQAAGYVVLLSEDIFKRKSYRGFTQRAQESLRHEPFGVSTYKAPLQNFVSDDGPDYEAMILDRQEHAMMGY